MSDTKYNVSTVLAAVSSFISNHDKEDYEGVFIVARQRNDPYQIFAGGTADDPEYVEEWMGAPFVIAYHLINLHTVEPLNIRRWRTAKVFRIVLCAQSAGQCCIRNPVYVMA